jgi:hypothetical protein
MQIKLITSLFVCAFAFTLISCSHSIPSPSPGAAVRYPTIVRLESRYYSITISAGPRCPLYSVSSATGEMFVENISLGDLHAAHPELYNLIAPALAPEASANAADVRADVYADSGSY